MDLSHNYVLDLVKINPELNDFVKNDELEYLRGQPINTTKVEYAQKENNLINKYSKLLKEKSSLNSTEKLLKKDLDKLNKQVDFPDNYFPITPLNNYFIERITEITCSGNFYIFTDINSYNDYIKRLKFIPDITNKMINSLKKGITKNMVYPKRLILQLILQLNEAIHNNNKKNKFNHCKKIPKQIEKKFLNAIQNNLISSMKKLVIFLYEEYLPKSRDTVGLKYLKNGRELYNEYVKEYTHTEYNAINVHKLGIEYKDIFLEKLLNLKDSIDPQLTLREFFERMKKHGDNKFKTKKELFDYLESLKKRIYNDVFLPNINDEIKKENMYLIKSVPKGNDSMTAYYQLPDLDNETKGTFYFNTLNLDKINKDELLVLSVHEGNPGHHYEYLYHSKNNKSLYRKFTTYSSYSEGWALYCELLTKHRNEYEYFWIIIYSLHRAIRLIVDTGIHWYGWSYEKSFAFMNELLPFDDKMIKDEIYRYIDDPGQALCYTAGAVCILKLRDMFLKKHNDIKLFHELILRIGPCDLDTLVDEFTKLIDSS